MVLPHKLARSAVITTTTPILSPRYPVIDAHNHLGVEFGGGWDRRPVQELVSVLDEAHVQVLINLDGMWSEEVLNRHLDHFKAAAPERFCIFGGVNWEAWAEQGDHFGEWAAARLHQQAARGAEGFKVWKTLGLQVRDHRGTLVPVDDPRLDPIWATAGDLGLPMVVHIADPVAFFWPLDDRNERTEELTAHPDWHFPSPPFPSFDSIVSAFANVVTRHAKTTFIGAHVGCYAENLEWVAALLDRCPNFYVDMSARLGELGRQPYAARRFFVKYSDRILFGTDMPADIGMYRLHYRFLETADEYFNYDVQDPPRQGNWHVYGLYLPDEVLEQVYHLNAERILLRKND